jgi:hypothetical protein
MANALKSKQLVVFKKQSGLGIAAGATGASEIDSYVDAALPFANNRVSSNVIGVNKMDKASIATEFGIKSGKYSDELQSGKQFGIIQSVLQQTTNSVITSGAQTTIAAAATTNNAGTLTWTGGNWINAGFSVGQIIRATGFATPATANNNHNFIVTSIATEVLGIMPVDNVAVVSQAAGDSVTVAVSGKWNYCPESSQVQDFYSIEIQNPDIDTSRLGKDCCFSKMAVKTTSTSISTIDFDIMGLDLEVLDGVNSPYFTSPTKLPSNVALSGAKGIVLIGGQAAGCVTSWDFTFDTGAKMPKPCITNGKSISTNIILEKNTLTGSAVFGFSNRTLFDYAVNSSDISLILALSENGTPNSNVMAFYIPRLLIDFPDITDDSGALQCSVKFTALQYIGSDTSIPRTILSVQDTGAV